MPGDDGSAQLRQAPVHALSQHTPSTQLPFSHCGPVVQLWPSFLSPHVPLRQLLSVSQSPSLWQLSVQAPLAQRNGEQLLRLAVRQVPRPSQVRAVFTLFPAQLGFSHSVSRGYFAHPATPSQVPLRPQLSGPWSVQMPLGSGSPASTGKQLPCRMGRSHFTHAPLHATLQHTLSAQKPDAHSVSFSQCAPFIFLPQLPD